MSRRLALGGLAAALLTSAGFTLANLFSSLVRNKGLAVWLGPEGYGQWSQILAFGMLVQTAASLGLTAGVTRYVAQYRREGRPIGPLLRTAAAFVTFVTVAVALLLVAASPWLARLVLDRGDWWWVMALTAAAAPVVALQAILQAALNGVEDYRGLAWAGIGSALAGLGVAFVAAGTLGPGGGALFVLGSFTLNAALHAWRLRRHLAGEQARATSQEWRTLDPALVRGLLAYGGVALVGAVLGAAGSLAARSALLHASGPAANGLYQAMSGLTLQILPVFLSGVNLYVMPRLGGVRDAGLTGQVVQRVLRIVALIVVPGLAGGVILREWFLALLFSPAFVSAAGWLPVQFSGDVMLAVAWAAGSFLLPTGRLRLFLAAEVLRSAIFIVVSVALLLSGIFDAGIGALAIAHLAAYGTICILYFRVLVREHRAAMGGLRALAFGAAALWVATALLSYTASPAWRLAVFVPLLAIYWRAFVEAGEWRQLTGLLRAAAPAPSRP